MADLQTRLAALITAIGADIKKLNQGSSTGYAAAPTPIGLAVHNFYEMSGATGAVAFGIPTGGASNGNTLTIRMKDNGTARALTWDAIYRAIDTVNVPLPTTTVAGKWMFLGFIYNNTDGKWDLVSVLKQT